MKKESDPRRRAIAAAICGAGVTAIVYDAGQRYRDELDARAACLRVLVADAAGQGDTSGPRPLSRSRVGLRAQDHSQR